MNHQGTVRLETDRLILRRFTPDDAEDMFRNWAQSEKVTKYMTWEPYTNIDDVKGYIQWVIDDCEKPDAYHWAIEYKENGQAIGAIDVICLNEKIASCAIGYCLGDAYWGMEIMPEAFREVIRFLFDEVGMNRIEATHDVRNPKSGRVMEKCGLRYEGTMRQADKNNQGICDSVMRAIIREDYTAYN